ncbi:hypothetical protein Vadar_003068 [Vaccinium darrowii]|uniref:Uncharacterized protein n=1 Tax=Vaccinium darrowii TaxID=229202 RepID=A0ACB7YSP2_9ERIC|nr:hypothetical protein Vadar_003068 [Vaccinium darrowii]
MIYALLVEERCRTIANENSQQRKAIDDPRDDREAKGKRNVPNPGAEDEAEAFFARIVPMFSSMGGWFSIPNTDTDILALENFVILWAISNGILFYVVDIPYLALSSEKKEIQLGTHVKLSGSNRDNNGLTGQLDNNHFDGTTTPHSYSNMLHLLKLSLRKCGLQGPDLSRIPGLAYMSLAHNSLNGSIPSIIWQNRISSKPETLVV